MLGSLNQAQCDLRRWLADGNESSSATNPERSSARVRCDEQAWSSRLGPLKIALLLATQSTSEARQTSVLQLGGVSRHCQQQIADLFTLQPGQRRSYLPNVSTANDVSSLNQT